MGKVDKNSNPAPKMETPKFDGNFELPPSLTDKISNIRQELDLATKMANNRMESLILGYLADKEINGSPIPDNAKINLDSGNSVVFVKLSK